jgi:cytochrome c-type biogenesis protein
MATETSEKVRPAESGAALDQPVARRSPVLMAGAALGGLVLLGAIGWVAWNQGALVGLRWVEFDSPLSLAVLGFLAGIGGFFAPCAFALFPGYVSYYLSASGETASVRRSLGLGLACAAGAASFFALVGAAITMLGGAISPYLIATKPAIALAVVALGVVQVLDVRMPSLALPLGLTADRGVPVGVAVFLYGFGYALASTGCTLPLYVSITVLPLTSGFSGAAMLTFLAFASAMALLMLVTTLLVGLAKQQIVSAFQRSAARIKRASGVVLILAGLYLGYFYLAAGM